jgi:hypothetical protein
MLKLKREKINVFGEASVSHVEKMWNTYVVIRECDGVILAKGKELKGYVGDIIRTMYTGETKYDGDYILESDRHGMVCKFPYGEPWELYVRH